MCALPSKSLLTYVRSELEKGTSRKAIRSSALSAAWPPAMVDDTFAYLDKIEASAKEVSPMSLKKTSIFISLIRFISLVLAIIFTGRLIQQLGVVFLLAQTMSKSTSDILPFEFLLIPIAPLGAFWIPIVFIATFLQAFGSLWVFIKLPARTSIIWKKTVIIITLVLLIELFMTQFSTTLIREIMPTATF